MKTHAQRVNRFFAPLLFSTFTRPLKKVGLLAFFSVVLFAAPAWAGGYCEPANPWLVSLTGISFIFMIIMIGFWRVLGKRRPKAKKVFTGLTRVFGLFFVILITFTGFDLMRSSTCLEKRMETRIYSLTKANLHNVFLACKAYWADKGPTNGCTVDIAKKADYGYIQSPDLVIKASGNEASFSATASFKESELIFTIDRNGTIEKQ